jgi:hypothetical protein
MVAHWAHLGGALVGYLYMRFQSYSRPASVPPSFKPERVLVSRPATSEVVTEEAEPTTQPQRRISKKEDPTTVEIDRVLDKISAQGMESLTTEERHFLNEVSEQRKKGE